MTSPGVSSSVSTTSDALKPTLASPDVVATRAAVSRTVVASPGAIQLIASGTSGIGYDTTISGHGTIQDRSPTAAIARRNRAGPPQLNASASADPPLTSSAGNSMESSVLIPA